MAVTKHERDLLLACQALAAMVREEFGYGPSGTPLSGIVTTWRPPGVTAEQIAALRDVEAEIEPRP